MPEATNKIAGFDLRTHTFDKRGRLKEKNLYRLHIQNGAHYYERPVDSGNLWTEGGEPTGRVEKIIDESTGKAIGKTFDYKAAHKKYTAPLTGAEKLSFENEDLKAKNASILAELAALRAEVDARTTPVKGPIKSGVLSQIAPDLKPELTTAAVPELRGPPKLNPIAAPKTAPPEGL